ncbi:MAG: integrase core domain-containing protein, partial [Pseudomonadota bacterium]
PDGQWMLQIARNLTDAEEGFLRGKRYLILDRDPLYTDAFRRLLKTSGTKPLRLPPWSPNLNAFAERFVLSIKSECLDRLILLGEGHLRTAVREYLVHYHEERNHQGLGNELIVALQQPANTNAPVEHRERLGGILKYYYRQAA